MITTPHYTHTTHTTHTSTLHTTHTPHIPLLLSEVRKKTWIKIKSYALHLAGKVVYTVKDRRQVRQKWAGYTVDGIVTTCLE